MQHAVADKQKLINRVRRLRGQVDAIERALETDASCAQLMRVVTASRGAINGIMAEIISGHVRNHIIDPTRKPSRREDEALEELLSVLRSYV